MRSIVVVAAVVGLLATVSSAKCDVIFGDSNLPFDEGAWTLGGSTGLITPDRLEYTGPTESSGWTSTNFTLQAPGRADGIEFEVASLPAGRWLVRLYDATGTLRMSTGTPVNSAASAGYYTCLCDRPSIYYYYTPGSYGDRGRLLWMTTGDPEYALLEVENVSTGQVVTGGGPMPSLPPFWGPFTLTVLAYPGVSVTIDRVHLIGDSIVPVEDTSWSGIKALYRSN